jgi:hypothetical protein
VSMSDQCLHGTLLLGKNGQFACTLRSPGRRIHESRSTSSCVTVHAMDAIGMAMMNNYRTYCVRLIICLSLLGGMLSTFKHNHPGSTDV